MKEFFIFLLLIYTGPHVEGDPNQKYNPDLIKYEKVVGLTKEQCDERVMENQGKIAIAFCLPQEVKEEKKK